MHETEDLLTLVEAANAAPGRPSSNCVWRWCRKGVLSRKGERLRLRHVRVGGRLMTSARWLAEFAERVAAADAEYFDARQAEADATPPPRRPPPRPLGRDEQRRREENERIARELDAAGL